MKTTEITNSTADQLISRCTRNGKFDIHTFAVEQCKLPPDQRDEVRYSRQIAKLLFGIEAPSQGDVDYYFWDTTTLALKQPLLELIHNQAKVLEIGPGAAGTLSVMLGMNKKNLVLHCAEINPVFVESAKISARKNGVNLKIFLSDMTQNVEDKFDVVFMNPPYVPSKNLQKLEIDLNSAEGRAGHGGETGSEVVQKFLWEVPHILNRDALAILGINTRHLEDSVVTALIERSQFQLERRYYGPEQAQPTGPYRQVYLLRKVSE